MGIVYMTGTGTLWYCGFNPCRDQSVCRMRRSPLYRLARHLVSLHFETPPERVKGALSPETLTDYISYGKGAQFVFCYSHQCCPNYTVLALIDWVGRWTMLPVLGAFGPNVARTPVGV